MKKTLVLSAFLVAFSSPLAFAQTAGAPPAPKDKAMDLPQAMLEAVARDITAKGLITQRVLEGGTFSVNVRYISGSETALQHGNGSCLHFRHKLNRIVI